MTNGEQLDRIRDYWQAQAESFDEEPDHGLRDPSTRAAWADLVLPLLPPPPAAVADLGCGTGSLSVLLAEAGHEVVGIDLAPGMVEMARAKADRHGVEARFEVGDASQPPLDEGSVDVVLVRHVVWALPDPDAALAGWARLLRPGGLLVLVEGHWAQPGDPQARAGLPASRLEELVAPHAEVTHVRQLPEPALWGKQVDDERYVLVATPRSGPTEVAE